MITAKIKKHWPIIIFSLIVGFLVIYPTLASIYRLGAAEFKGVYPVFNYDRFHYMATIEDVYEGHLGLGHAFFKEHKNQPYIQPPLAGLFFSSIAKITHLNIPDLFFAMDFVLPILTILLLYLLFYRLSGSRLLSFAFTALHAAIYLAHYYMSVNPQLSFILFFFGLYFLMRVYILESGGRVRAVMSLLTGMTTGILVYIYPYFWTSLFVLFFICAAFFYFYEKKNIAYIKNCGYYLAAFLIIFLPYLFNMYEAVKDVNYTETMLRFGMLNTHWPSAYYNIIILATALSAIILAKRFFDNKKLWYFALALPLSGIILSWQNVITGKFLQFSTHYQRIAVLFSMMVFILIFSRANLDKIKAEKKRSVALLIIFFLFVFLALNKEIKRNIDWFSDAFSKQKMADLQAMSPLFDWLKNNTLNDSVIFTLNNNLEMYLPVYSRNNLYYQGYGGYYLMSDNELENRFMARVIFDKSLDENTLKQDDLSIWNNKFVDQYQNAQVKYKIFGKILPWIKKPTVMVPAEYRERLINKYREYKNGKAEDLIRKYELDYVIISDFDQDWREQQKIIEDLKFFKLEKNLGHYWIYKMI